MSKDGILRPVLIIVLLFAFFSPGEAEDTYITSWGQEFSRKIIDSDLDIGWVEFYTEETPDSYYLDADYVLNYTSYVSIKDDTLWCLENRVSAEYKKVNGKFQTIPTFTSEIKVNITTKILFSEFTLKSDGYYLTYTQYGDFATRKELKEPVVKSIKVNISSKETLIPLDVLPLYAPCFFRKNNDFYFFSVISTTGPAAFSFQAQIIEDCEAYREKTSDGGYMITFSVSDQTMIVYYDKNDKITDIDDGAYNYTEKTEKKDK